MKRGKDLDQLSMDFNDKTAMRNREIEIDDKK
jgi:hypothetical protein